MLNMSTLADEVLRWNNETRAILISIKRIVEYFGTDDEFDSLLAALKFAEAFFEGVVPALGDPTWRADVAGIRAHQFACGRTIAGMISPLLQLIVEPVPEFVPLARIDLPRAHCSTLIRHVGAFTGSIDRDICEPIWRDFPDLAPEGWQMSRIGPKERSQCDD
jgi:hypothetical protein